MNFLMLWSQMGLKSFYKRFFDQISSSRGESAGYFYSCRTSFFKRIFCPPIFVVLPDGGMHTLREDFTYMFSCARQRPMLRGFHLPFSAEAQENMYVKSSSTSAFLRYFKSRIVLFVHLVHELAEGWRLEQFWI